MAAKKKAAKKPAAKKPAASPAPAQAAASSWTTPATTPQDGEKKSWW